MTDRKKAMEALLEKVEAGEFDLRHNSTARQVFPYLSATFDDLGLTARDAFNGSLDAAEALHDAVLPGWSCALNTNGGAQVIGPNGERRHGLKQDAPARAWLIAILKALIEQEGGE